MALIKTTTGTFSTTGTVVTAVQLSKEPKKFYASVVAPDGGTSIATGCVGFAKDGKQWASSYGRDQMTSDIEDRDDRCIYIFDIDQQGNKTTLLEAEFVEFDNSLASFGFYIIKFNVQVANPSYQYMLRLHS